MVEGQKQNDKQYVLGCTLNNSRISRIGAELIARLNSQVLTMLTTRIRNYRNNCL